ncbi:hypothetical protein [Sulfurimonas sp.]|uniref:hypothetical protein n=1 Tax=Sulfurimonas sp. TaxID=2022749 RepID=UPI002612F881|nr:hypothetical protein [Sulfurimonas sp.]MDD3452579.1 hypothetical protein [Sulfurimonas sp.]
MAIADKVCEEHDKSLGCSALGSRKFKEHDAIRKLSAALGERMQPFFSHGSLMGDELVLYLTHPGIVSEFGMQKAQILGKMREIYKEENLKQSITFRRVRAALKPKPAPATEKKESTADRATGDFEIFAEDEGIKRRFERIRAQIKANNQGG